MTDAGVREGSQAPKWAWAGWMAMSRRACGSWTCCLYTPPRYPACSFTHS